MRLLAWLNVEEGFVGPVEEFELYPAGHEGKS